MVKIRLKRSGQKKAPFYKIVVTDSRVSRNGKYIESVGICDPQKEIKIDSEKALKWLHNGAQPTDTVRDLFSKQGIMKLYHESKISKQDKKNSQKEVKVAQAKTTKKATTKKEAK